LSVSVPQQTNPEVVEGDKTEPITEENPDNSPPKSDDGTLAIPHEHKTDYNDAPEPNVVNDQPENTNNDIDELLKKISEPPSPDDQSQSPAASYSRPLATQPPSMGGTLTANTLPEGLDPSVDPMSLPKVEPPLLSRSAPQSIDSSMPPVPPLPSNPVPTVPPTPEPAPVDPEPGLKEVEDNQTLSDIEQAVHSPHAAEHEEDNLENARDAVASALNEGSANNPPVAQASLNALPLGDELHKAPVVPEVSKPEIPSSQVFIDSEGNFQQGPSPQVASNITNEPAPIKNSPADQPLTMPLPPTTSMTPTPPPGPGAPPPVPPPIIPPPYNPSGGPN
jgi:hypothetical protein